MHAIIKFLVSNFLGFGNYFNNKMEYIVQVKYNTGTLYENRKIYLPSRFFLDLI